MRIAPLGIAQAADLPVKARPGAYCDPYVNYSCLDAYLGDDPFTRFFRYYQLEWGKDGAPTDPKAPPGRRAGWPGTPQVDAADAVHRMALWRLDHQSA